MKKRLRVFIAAMLSLCLLLSGIYYVPWNSKGADVQCNVSNEKNRNNAETTGTDNFFSEKVYGVEKEIEAVTPNTEGTDDGVTDVLFIGNSMTYYNTLCNVVQGIAAHKGHNLKCTAATNGGQNLIYQAKAENVLDAIHIGGYDVVVLQDIVGSFDGDDLQKGADAIIPIIKQYNPKARIIFYEPWPTKDTISGSSSLLPYFTFNYICTAKSVGATLAPAGEAFYELYTDKGLDFYCADMKHPQPLGTFTSASTVYHAMYPEEEYKDFTSADQTYLDNLINTNVAYTNEGKQSTYSLDTLNLIFSLGYKYAHAVIPAVSGDGTYTSVAGIYDSTIINIGMPTISAISGDTTSRSVSFSWRKASNATKYTTYVGREEDGIVAKAYYNNYAFEKVGQTSVDHLKATAGTTVTYTVVGYDAEGNVVARGTVSIDIPDLTDEEKAQAELIAKIDTDENLAKNAESFVSSKTGSNIVDGKLTTNWQADPAENPDDDPTAEYFGVDLGSEQTIGMIIIAWENSYATAYDIYVAGEDGVYGESPVASDVASGNNPIVITKISATKARYVKVVPTELSAYAKTYGTCVYELAVFSKSDEKEPSETQSTVETESISETESVSETQSKSETESVSETQSRPETETEPVSETESTKQSEPINVLFVGNSMTYYNTLCKVVEGFAKIQGKQIQCTASTEGGKNLIYHTTYPQTVSAIQSGKYDVVVLQDIVGSFNGNNLLEGATTLNHMIKKYNPKARVILYMPWPTKNTLTGTSGRLPYFTYHYIKAARSIGASLAPAGEAWYTIVGKYPKIEWYTDGKHPHAIGTFVSACSIYYALYPDSEKIVINNTNKNAVNQVINKNIAYSNDAAKQYDAALLNDISSYGYYYTHAVKAAVEDKTGQTHYKSVAGEYSDPNDVVNTSVTEVKVGKTKVKKAVKKLSAKKIKIVLKKIKGAKKYQIQISKTKKFKKKLFKKTVKKINITIKSRKLANKKKLYVRARAIKTVNGIKYSGKWSKTRKVKIKK